MSTLTSVIARGTRAAQPASTSLPVGSLYFVTDEYRIERNNGTSWDPFMVSGLILLEEHTASASASLDFTTRNKSGLTGATFQSDFDEYLIEFISILPATNNVTLQSKVTTDGGSTWDASAVYARTFQYGAANGTTSGGGVTGANQWDVTGNQSSTATGALTGSLKLYNPRSAVVHKAAIGDLQWLHTTVDWIGYHTALVWKTATAINGIRFLMSSGNIASGTIRIYGVNKS